MKLLNDLRRLDIEDYKNCLDFIVGKISNSEFIISVYQFGQIKFPGISDIDLMFIVDNLENYEEKKKNIENIIKSAPNSDYCFHHGSIIICKDDIKYLGFFHSTENLNLLFGKSFSTDSIKYKFGKDQILNWNIFFYISCLEMLTWSTPFSQRFFLLVINNLATSIKNNDFLFATDYFTVFKEKVDHLRIKSLENIDVDFSNESKSLLYQGLEIIKYQETKIIENSGFNIIFQSKKRIFLSSKEPHLKEMGGFTLYFLPKRYFKARNNFIKNATILLPDDKNLQKFYEMRDRFASFKIIGLEKG